MIVAPELGVLPRYRRRDSNVAGRADHTRISVYSAGIDKKCRNKRGFWTAVTLLFERRMATGALGVHLADCPAMGNVPVQACSRNQGSSFLIP